MSTSDRRPLVSYLTTSALIEALSKVERDLKELRSAPDSSPARVLKLVRQDLLDELSSRQQSLLKHLSVDGVLK